MSIREVHLDTTFSCEIWDSEIVHCSKGVLTKHFRYYSLLNKKPYLYIFLVPFTIPLKMIFH